MIKKVVGSPLRWTGSKRNLLNEMLIMFDTSKTIYVEPFLGSGIVLLNTLECKLFREYYVNDVNTNVINFYTNLQNDFAKLDKKIKAITNEYNKLINNEQKEIYYYGKRKQFNEGRINQITRSSVFWFLMKTGFNGVYRVNSKQIFNVPFGKKYQIVYEYSFFLELSKKIQNVHFFNMDYQEFLLEIENRCNKSDFFIYCDPPYLPETEMTKNQILYTSIRFEHGQFLEFLSNRYMDTSSIMISMSKSIASNVLYNQYFDSCIKVNDIIRKVNPKKNLKSVEEGYFNYEFHISETPEDQ